jgi:hypothetical protein
MRSTARSGRVTLALQWMAMIVSREHGTTSDEIFHVTLWVPELMGKCKR